MPATTNNVEDFRSPDRSYSDPNSRLYIEYESDLLDNGFALFTYEANARAFADGFRKNSGHECEVKRNRDSRWAVTLVK